INVAGSLRMHSYRIMLEQHSDGDDEVVREIFNNPVMLNVITTTGMSSLFEQLKNDWTELHQLIHRSDESQAKKVIFLNRFVSNINDLVLGIQQHAESKIRTLRLFQILAFFITVALSAIIIYWIHRRFTQPLHELTNIARQISRGDFSCSISVNKDDDELGLLSRSFERMCKAIAYMYESLEAQVEEKTTELRNSNKTLAFLYNIARRITTHEINRNDFSSIVQSLSDITGLTDIELCLLTENGDIPYLQINGNKSTDHNCQQRDCRECMHSETSFRNELHYPVIRENIEHGVLVIRNPPAHLEAWQHDLLVSVAGMLAIALTLQSEEENIRRIALMNERNVIARELHDSLAQALSYLKIQVSRLNRSIGKEDYALMMDVSAELKQGLDSAYRQLRELLTTFRLKVDGRGLNEALIKTVNQFREQSNMQISLNYQIMNIPLTSQEEIHLLQIIRETCQNAIHHSQGNSIRIQLSRSEQDELLLQVEDDGIGIGTSPEKTNHYGMAIIKERAEQLGGNIEIRALAEGGTGVY
ncbi:MAG: HAMP domain-containing protein, partial [Erysipelotrichia bacterium]|nr:HAMP domain-containing protein [Erysipelotrichia bacterium]